MELNKRTCKRCKHSWNLRKPVEPVICPKCKSPYWNRDIISKFSH